MQFVVGADDVDGMH